MYYLNKEPTQTHENNKVLLSEITLNQVEIRRGPPWKRYSRLAWTWSVSFVSAGFAFSTEDYIYCHGIANTEHEALMAAKRYVDDKRAQYQRSLPKLTKVVSY